MDKKVKILTEMAVAVALATILNFLPLWKMPQGGTISLEMLPVFIIALRWGIGPGFMSGIAYGLLQLAFGAYIVHPVQLILDYPLPYMLVGLAGLFSFKIKKLESKALYGWLLLAVLLGGITRLGAHILSGAIFFGQYAPEGQNVWLYSIIYNGSFLLPSMLLNYLVLIPLTKKLIKDE